MPWPLQLATMHAPLMDKTKSKGTWEYYKVGETKQLHVLVRRRGIGEGREKRPRERERERELFLMLSLSRELFLTPYHTVQVS